MPNRPVPHITSDTTPREAVHLALDWLAAVVTDVRSVRAMNVLRRVRGSMYGHVRLQSSTYSRRGVGTWANLYVSVLDGEFRRWRDQHPELTWRTGDLVHATGTLSPPVQLFGEKPGYRTLTDLPDLVEDWLGVLDLFESPARLAREYDATLVSSFVCMEWMVFRGDIVSARTLLERYLDAHPLARDTIQAGRAAGLPPRGTPIRNELLERWAPTLETLGILATGEPLPGIPTDAVPQQVDSAAEIRGILSRFGRVEEV